MKQVLHKSKENYDGNKIIREFMEGENGVIVYSNYHLDWNALMTAVQKCDKVSWGQMMYRINDALTEYSMQSVYDEVLKFIEFYKENK